MMIILPIVITHYQRLLDYIVPDFCKYILYKGRIETAGKELALVLGEKGTIDKTKIEE